MESNHPEERGFLGVWISCDVWLSKKFTLLQKCMIAEIQSLSAKKGYCYSSNKYFAEFFECTEGHIANTISKLSGTVLTVTVKKGNKREIRLNKEYRFDEDGPSFKNEGAVHLQMKGGSSVDEGNIDNKADNKEKDLRLKSNFPEPLKAEKEKGEVGGAADSVRYTPSDEIKMATAKADLKARVKYVLDAPWNQDIVSSYQRSKSNLISDAVNEMIMEGFVYADNGGVASWVRKFVNNRTKKTSERTFSEETTKIVNDLIERTLNASPYNKLMQPLRDFEKTKIAEWVESKPGIYHWHAFDILIDLFSRLGGSPEYLTVSNALGKYAEDNKENLKMEYNLRLKRLGLK